MENLIQEKFLRIDVDDREKNLDLKFLKTKRFIENLWDDVSHNIELSVYFYNIELSFAFLHFWII